jgi:8-oxo-dGTP pyrophosphatase MutT (NUDIX family)
MDNTRRLPPELVEHARAFAKGGRLPAEPRPAATVVLLRPSISGAQAYLLRRHLGMAFAGGMYAFPGGGVDARDTDTAIAWAGPSTAQWAHRMRCEEPLARSLVCAAVRETFEESGVLLAGATQDTVVDDTTGADWESDRQALVERELAFSDFLGRRRLVLRSDLLGYWAHWITPAFEPRRFDTRFFVAALPVGQRTRDVSGEADRVAWMRPVEAVAGVDDGRMRMLPPTYVTMAELADLEAPEQALRRAEIREVRTIVPVAVFDESGGYLTIDEDE